jgi:shikimate dehydrogenase
MITGKTKMIAHFGYPTEAFKAPMIYNPWFEMKGIDVVVIPMGVKPVDYPTTLPAVFRMSNIHGALVTMPHKVMTTQLVNELSTTAKIAGSSNAILLRPDGSLLGDMFDGAGFVRGVERLSPRLLASGCGHITRPST